jgi:hypothetical protein
VSRDEDYELWLAMNEDFEAATATEPVVAEPVIAPTPVFAPMVETVVEPVVEPVAEEPVFEPVVPAEFNQIFEQAVDQEEVSRVEDVEPELEFELSPNLFREPQTNTIVIQPVDPLSTGSIITDAGEIVLTGSIELPVLPTTGGIAIIQLPEGDSADGSLAEDFAENYVSSIAPVRASGVMNSRARESVLPIKNRRGESQSVLLGVASILMVTVGALLIAAFWLGVIKF